MWETGQENQASELARYCKAKAHSNAPEGFYTFGTAAQH